MQMSTRNKNSWWRWSLLFYLIPIRYLQSKVFICKLLGAHTLPQARDKAWSDGEHGNQELLFCFSAHNLQGVRVIASTTLRGDWLLLLQVSEEKNPHFITSMTGVSQYPALAVTGTLNNVHQHTPLQGPKISLGSLLGPQAYNHYYYA